MKKIFFLKSSSSQGGEHHERSAARSDKKHPGQVRQKAVGSQSMENKFQNAKQLSTVCERKNTERKTISRSLVLRRSRSLSMSSAATDRGRSIEEDKTGLRNRQKFPSSNSLCDCQNCHFQLEGRDQKPERCNVAAIELPSVEGLNNRTCYSPSNPSSPQSSCCSSPISGPVLDLYMDVDHHREMKIGRNDGRSSNPNGLHSRFFCEESNLFIPSQSTSRASLRSEHQRESPRKLAKDVVDRLLRLDQYRDSNSGDICPNWPPMPTTVCDKHLDRQSYTQAVDISRKGSKLKEILGEDKVSFNNCNSFLEQEYGTVSPDSKGDATDLALRRKLEEVNDRSTQFSRELAQESSFGFYADNVSALTQLVRHLIEEERNLMHEFSDHLRSRIAERDSAKKEASLMKEEMNAAIMKLERQRDELQSRLHTELDRRSGQWESKVREFQTEENRLRDRLRELAEQNVCLQRELSTSYDKEKEYTDRTSRMEAHLKVLMNEMELARSENDNLQKKLCDTRDKLEVAENVRSSMERKFKEKSKESAELLKTVSRLRETCSEQERTIDGLRQCLKSEIKMQQVPGNLEKLTHKLQIEQLRLTEVEQTLRRQLETCTVEIESLRHENIYLLDRLRSTGKMSGPSALKLDQELAACVQCLQNNGLALLNESIRMCEKLLEILGRKAAPKGLLETHTLIQYDMKVQGFKQGLEQLIRSLKKAADALKHKTDYESKSSETSNGRSNHMNEIIEDDLIAELKAETLLTSILKEKLYSKEKEVERVQAELVKTLQSHDVLTSEIQDAFDTVSCLNHKMKNLELQMIEKDGTINQLQGEVQSQSQELATTRVTLSKITQERDLMWEEVKQYSEKNMLLNREVTSLKKKLDALEEDTLLKDGQISILKDSLNNARPFNALFGSDQGEVFKL